MNKILLFNTVAFSMLCGTFLYGQQNMRNAEALTTARTYYDKSDVITDKHFSDGGSKALGVELWSDDFSDATKWVKGNGLLWQQGEWQFGAFPATSELYQASMDNAPTASNGYAYFDAVPYWDAPQPNNKQHSWLQVANSIDLTGHTTIALSFYSGFRKFVTAKAWVDYSLDEGSTWDSIQLLSYIPTNGAYAGMDKVIIDVNNSDKFLFRFRWDDSQMGTNGGGYGWAVDDVSISSLTDVDIQYKRGVYHVESYWYSKIPKDQVHEMTVEAYVANRGSTTLTNVHLDLTGDVTATSDILASLQTSKGVFDTLLKVSFTPSATLGTYNIQRSLKMDQTDEVPENSTFVDFGYEITDTIYAVDRGNLNIMAWNPYVSAKIDAVGVTYDIFKDQTLSAVDVKFHESSLPEGEVRVEIYPLDADALTNLGLFKSPVASSPLFVLGDRSTSEFISIPLSSPVELHADSTYLALVIPSDTNTIKIEQGSNSNVFLSPQLYHRVIEDAEVLWLSTRRNAAIRLNFGKVLPLCEIAGGSNSFCVDSKRKYIGIPATGGQWDTSDYEIATIDASGELTGLKPGSVDIIYKGSECQEVKRTVIITPCNPVPDISVSIKDIELITALSIFPNPANDEVNIEFDLKRASSVILELSDLNGRVLESLTLDNTSMGTNNVSMNLSSYDQGVYMLVLRSDNTQSISKLIKH